MNHGGASGFLSALPAHLRTAATKVCQKTSKNSLEDIIELARQDIAQIAGVSASDAEQLHVAVAAQLFPAQTLRKSMLDILVLCPPKRLSTGCEIMDSALGGGISSGCGLIEVCGESASGKTQLCIQLLLQAQLPVENGGLGGAALFISTKPDTGRRHEQLLAHYKEKYGETLILSQNLRFTKAGDPAELIRLLQRDLRVLVRANGIKIIAIDSITSLMTGIFENDEKDQKTAVLYAVAKELKLFADDCGVIILVTNHVSDFMGHSSDVSRQQMLGGCWMSGGRPVIPSLGLFWSNCVSTRIILSRTLKKVEVPNSVGLKEEDAEDAAPEVKRRKLSDSDSIMAEFREMRVQFSSFCSDESRIGFVILQDGLRGVSLD